MLLAFIGKLVIALLVWFGIILGVDKFLIKDTGFDQGGSELLWASIIGGFFAAIIVFIIL